MVIDLHAAQIDQNGAASFGFLELADGVGLALGEDGAAFDIEGIWLQRSLAAGFGHTDGIENAKRHIMAAGGGNHLAFADIGIRLGGEDQPVKRKCRGEGDRP